MNNDQIEYLEQLEKEGDYAGLINEIRLVIKDDKTVFTHPFIKRWAGVRWRNIFLTEALGDSAAVENADRSSLLGGRDTRSDKQKLAEQYIKGDASREWQLDLPAVEQPASIPNTTLIFAPGLLAGMLPVRAFQTPFPSVEKKLGIRILRADCHPMRGCKANGDDLLRAIEQGDGLTADAQEIPGSERTPPGDFLLMGYSKGAPDIYQLLVNRPDLKDRIRGIFNWGGAIGGSYLANDTYESIKDLSIPQVESTLASFLSVISPAINVKAGALKRIDEYNILEAIEDLTTEKREQFLHQNMDMLRSFDIPIFNLTGSTTAMDVPYFQIQGVMALNRYDANNDMQLTQSEATLDIPMATDLAMLNAHHWDLSYDPFPKLMRFGSPHLDHPFPKEAAATAIIMLAFELGLID